MTKSLFGKFKLDNSLKIVPWSLKIKTFMYYLKIKNWKLKIILLFFILLFPAISKAAVLNKAPNNLGLVGYWSMNEGVGTKAGDSSGKGNSGTITGATWTSGKLGKALSFNGTSNYVNAGSASSLKPSLPITFSAWIKPNVIVAEGIISFRETFGHNGYWANIGADGSVVINYGDNTGQCAAIGRRSKASGASVVSAGQWYHVVGVLTGATNMNIYINGVDVGGSYTGTGAAIAYNAASFLSIGRNGGTGACAATFFNGSIDEARIYNCALSATEVANLYQSGSVKMGSTNTPQGGVRPVDESLPANAVVGLVRQDCTGYTYCATSLSAWQTMMLGGSGPIDWTGCTVGDLVCKNKIAVAKIDGPWSSPDSTRVSISGWNTGANNYIRIYTTATARHDGKRNTSKYRLIS